MGGHQRLVKNFLISREEIITQEGDEQVCHEAVLEYVKDSRLNAFFVACAIPTDESIGGRSKLGALVRNSSQIGFQNFNQLGGIKRNAIVLYSLHVVDGERFFRSQKFFDSANPRRWLKK